METGDNSIGSQEFEHQDTLLDVPISSDTVLTTHDLHQNVEVTECWADPDDNSSNSRVPEVFTSAIKTSISKSIIHNVEEEMPSQDKRDVDDIHVKQLGSSIDFPVIPMLTPEEQTSHIHPKIIDDSTTLLVDKMITERPTASSAPSSDFIKQWLSHVQDVSEEGPSTYAVLSQENIQELCRLNMEEVYSISQQLLTSQLPNEDYASIVLTNSQNVADLREIIVEADNGNKWLDVNATVSMPEALQSLREEYMTSIGPICKENSPTVIVDAVNEAYKSQIKANHQMGKGIAKELNTTESIIDTSFRNLIKRMDDNSAKIFSVERTCGDLKKKVGTIDSTISTLQKQQTKMVDLMKEQVDEHKQTTAKVNALYTHIYGDAPPDSLLNGLTAEDATRREFDAHSATVATTKSIIDFQTSVSLLFSAQAIITNNVQHLTEASTQIRKDMHHLLLIQQQIMTALHFPTPMLKPPTTSIAAVPAHSVNPSTSTLPDNNPEGEKRMVGPNPNDAWNQQVAAHRNNTDQKEKLELEILKQVSLREFEDDEFLRRLRYLIGSVEEDR